MLRDGTDVVILIHIEVQSQSDANFPLRMYVYHYRIRDRYNQPVVSLAILGDEDPNWRPSEYRTEQFGCRLSFQFPTIKLWDFIQRMDELLLGTNPMALIVLAHLQSHLTNQIYSERMTWKGRLLRRVLDMGWTPKQIRQVCRIIDWLLELPQGLEKQLHLELAAYQERNNMPRISSFEQFAKEEGIAEGLQQGLLESLSFFLENRFGVDGLQFVNEIRTRKNVELDLLRQIQRAIPSANNIEELRALLPKN